MWPTPSHPYPVPPVLQRSSSHIKFWLVENFLSPQFKEMVPKLADRYGFEVELVTYKWPNWLHQQTEKQRTIWGYKILFLDVLFPLNLTKVIYVDADQVFRADIRELWDMDLKGKPYAYTPFCTSRQETLGFQFWQQGYWKDHLQGRPYHIRCAREQGSWARCLPVIASLQLLCPCEVKVWSECVYDVQFAVDVVVVADRSLILLLLLLQCAVRGGSGCVPPVRGGRPVARHLRQPRTRPQLPCKPRPGLAELRTERGAYPLAACGVAVV